MSLGVLLGGADSLHLHREVKPSWTVGVSLLFHALLFSVIMFALQKPISHPLLIQSYPVSLVSIKPAVTYQQEKVISLQETPPSILPEPAPLEMAPPSIQPTIQSVQKEVFVKKQVEPVPLLKSPPEPSLPAPDLPKVKPIEDIRFQNRLPDLIKEKKSEPTFFKLPPLPPSVPADTRVPEVVKKESPSVVSTPPASVDYRISTGSSASINAPMSKYPYYFSGIKIKIDAQWSPPPIPRTSFGKGDAVATVRFIIKRDGHINKKSIQIEKSSGNNFFDAAALRAVYNADPLLPLPEGITEELHVHFEFKLNLGS